LRFNNQAIPQASNASSDAELGLGAFVLLSIFKTCPTKSAIAFSVSLFSNKSDRYLVFK